MNRRDLLKAAAWLSSGLCPISARADVPPHLWQSYDFGSGIFPRERLNQGPFNVDQDQGWQTILFTTPSEKPLRNPGLGLVGYAWEESGPSLAARAGRETLEQHVEAIASLPFTDVLYIRCDWRNVQTQAGKLSLHPVWPLALDAAKRHGLRLAFRVQLSNYSYQPKELALPEFLRARIPLVKIGHIPDEGNAEFVEPRYDHPEFLKAFTELNDLLGAAFDGHPQIEWMDLMQYGFWGEGHTNDFPRPIPDYATAERTFLNMTALQLKTWKRTPLAVNTQPDISGVGNRAVIDLAVRAGAWLRSDSIIIEEPEQIEELAHRPPWLAAILEDGYFRQYDVTKLAVDLSGVNELENYMLHVLDVRANYWSLWTESANLMSYYQKYPRGIDRLRTNLGYRLRPSWVWQRKRFGTFEIVVSISNRGVAAVPGVLWLQLNSADQTLKMRGSLDPGHPFANSLRQAAFLLPQGFAGELRLFAQIEIRPGVLRDLAWATEQPCNADGSITIQMKPMNDPAWRKGI